MVSPTVYRLINKSSNIIEQYRSTDEIFMYLLGRSTSNYILIKSDSKGDRVINFSLSLNMNSYTPESFAKELNNK